MDGPLFPGEPRPLPPQSGSTWVVTSADPPKPPPVRHAAGYRPFVDLAEAFGTDPRALFDLWTFAHFVRAHRQALESDQDLLHAAIVFLGNTLTARFPECIWVNKTNGLAIVSEQEGLTEMRPGAVELPEDRRRLLGVGGTVPALLRADEARFREFQGVADSWSPGAPPPAPRQTIPFRPGD